MLVVLGAPGNCRPPLDDVWVGELAPVLLAEGYEDAGELNVSVTGVQVAVEVEVSRAVEAGANAEGEVVMVAEAERDGGATPVGDVGSVVLEGGGGTEGTSVRPGDVAAPWLLRGTVTGTATVVFDQTITTLVVKLV